MKERPIPEKTRAVQLAVSDPSASAWVSANAGSGKTYVLAQRVIRLLLRGTPPGRILCLTFTKAAAAHMANQVLKTLRDWVRLDDETLDRKLALIDGGKPSPERRANARRLFATALETPGGLKVQTIHAFCDRILHQFPFEARVPAGFKVLDESSEAELLQRAQADVLREAARAPSSDLGKALALAVSTDTDSKLVEIFGEVVRARRKLFYLLDTDGLARAEQEIRGALGLTPGDTLGAVETEILDSEFLPRSEWTSIAEALQTMEGNANKCGELLAEAESASSVSETLDFYFKIFFTKEGAPKKEGQFGKAEVRAKAPRLFARLLAEGGRLPLLLERRRAAAAFERTCALNKLGRALIGHYEAMKRARGALDYGDLVSKTADLLEDQAAAWVHYKLDGGIDHILIDEAQDTSPEQWKVVDQLTKEFFAGKGASERRRTIFAVGDEKQSIFGFQGAEPESFERMRRSFQTRVENAAFPFEPKRLDLSFRSAAGIVEAVDEVFREPESFRGLSSSADETRTIHTAIRNDAPALVEVWDTVRVPEEKESELAWDAPLDSQRSDSAPAMLAGCIAKAVNIWLTKPSILIGDPLTEEPRPPHAGDIIVLVRSRGPLFEAILRELKQTGIPVAGADRLKLSEHIAVMDIAALCDALLLSSNDLALACALKSSLFGFSEEDLFKIAHERKGTLYDALAEHAPADKKFSDAVSRLARWRSEARRLRPFDFLSRVLGRDKGRERILARLGFEAADALDELLALALNYETMETPSLPGFLIFLRRGGSQVKRDLEVESRAVRVMTVHGVKGLEAPIIVLADTTSAPDSKRHHPKLMPLAGAALQPFVWATGEDSEAIVRAREGIVLSNEGEHRRLLYVALTRARDALIVCGSEAKRSKLPGGCWYSLVRGALEKEEKDFVEIPDHGYGFDEKVFRWRYRPGKAVTPVPAPEKTEIPEPAWLRTPFSDSPRAKHAHHGERILSSAQHRNSGSRAEARKRGVLIHRLLQELPRLEPAQQAARAKHYLERFAADIPEAARTAIAAEALKVIGAPELAGLFGPGSRAEVSILGKWKEDGQPFEDFGRVDRLAVTERAVWIADFKSDAIPPSAPEDAPEAYLRQLARYRAVLAKLYPNRAMQAFLVWTTKGAVQEIPAALLDKAFARFTAA